MPIYAYMPPLSTILAANLTPAAYCPRYQQHRRYIYQCQQHQWCTLSCEYFHKFEKIENGPNGILRGLRETDSWKNLKLKISWHCPFKLPFAFTKVNSKTESRRFSLAFLSNWKLYSISVNLLEKIWNWKSHGTVPLNFLLHLQN